MVRRAGRPAQIDSEGNRISKCIVNVTIPTKLRDFLIKNDVNRSKLFTDVVLRMHSTEICPKCYRENLTDGVMALRCDDCDKVIKYNECDACNAKYQNATVVNNVPIPGNRPIPIKGSDRFGCQVCLE
jgi:hypothetical protein